MLPCTIKGRRGTVTLHQGGIHIESKRVGGNHTADIPWQELAAVDFLAPNFFRNGHIHFATFNDPRGLTFSGNSDPMTSSFRNPHYILFDWAKSRAYKQLRDLLIGASAPPPPYQPPAWQPRQAWQQPQRQAQPPAWQPPPRPQQ